VSTYWEERARIIAERDAEIEAEPEAPVKPRAKRAPVEQPPAAEPATADQPPKE
jgi:hypothetical protein